jgi:hypothetical protein
MPHQDTTTRPQAAKPSRTAPKKMGTQVIQLRRRFFHCDQIFSRSAAFIETSRSFTIGDRCFNLQALAPDRFLETWIATSWMKAGIRATEGSESQMGLAAISSNSYALVLCG